MSRQFLLDGYNIINQMPFKVSDSLEDQRAALVKYVQNRSPQGSPRNAVTIVFDGKSGMVSPAVCVGVKIIFASDTNADDRIKKIVEDSDRPRDFVVVSDDKDIRIYVRTLGARVQSVKEFLKYLKPETLRPAVRGKKSPPEPRKNISKTMEHTINQEMADIWLKKKE